MARVQKFIPSFNAGELSPRLMARTDFNKYASGLERCENLIPLPEGGVMRRSATRFVSEVSDSSVKSRLRPFKFSTTQAYMTEFGNRIIRFYRNQGRITVGTTDAAITNGTFTSNITGWDDRSTGGAGNAIAHDATNGRLTLQTNGTAADDIGWAEQDVVIGAAYQATEHVVKFQVLGAPGDRVQIRIGSTSTGAEILADFFCYVGYHTIPFTPNTGTVYIQFRNLGVFRDKDLQIDNVALINNAVVSVDTPYLEADLYELVTFQSNDKLYIFHEGYPTHRLERYGNTRWALIEVEWLDGPWLAKNASTTTLTASAATGLGVTLTASSTEGINDGQGFQTTDIGRLVRLTDSATENWGWGIIVARTSTLIVTVDVRRTFSVATPETTWRLGAWSGTTGYASCGAFYEQRMIPAGTVRQPQTFWGSQTGDFENFAPDSPNTSGVWNGTVEDDDSFDYELSADDVHNILWISAGEDTLAIGTQSGEWVPESEGAVLTPTDITVRQQTSHGSARVQPVRIDHVVLFAQRAKRKIREFGFGFETDGYVAPDMTRLAQHITRGGIVEMEFAEEPNSLVWCVRADGRLMSMTFRRDEDVVGWARHRIGGSFSSGIAVVESVAAIPGADGSGQVKNSEDRDEVWVIVKRTINSTTERYIEVLEGDFESPNRNDYDDEDDWVDAVKEAQKDAYYADSVITYDGAATDTITGLSHLEGQTVKVLADGGRVSPDLTVASGSITLPAAASVVQVGLGYTHRLKTLKHEGGSAAGTAVGQEKRITGVTFVLMDALVMMFGEDETDLREIDFREVLDDMDSPAPLFSGERFESFSGDWQTDPRIFVESDAPVPYTLLAMVPRVDVRDQP
jgi:uncharacterized protein YjlB